MTEQEYSNRILSLARLDNKDNPLITQAMEAYVQGNYTKIDEILAVLEKEDLQLLESLVEKLKGKSVYTGLRKLLSGKSVTTEQAIISTSSLITHAAIELKEYKRLLPSLYKKLGILLEQL